MSRVVATALCRRKHARIAWAALLRRQNGVATALCLFFVISDFALAKPPLEEISEHTYPLPARGSLSVRNTDGTIYIYGWAEDTIKVTARKKAYSEERLKQISINVGINGETASIDTVYPPKPEGLSLADRSGTVDYVLVVPQTCTIAQAELLNGEIIVEGLRGRSVNARLTSGRLLVKNCFTDLTVAVAHGGLDVFYDWWEPLKFALVGEIAHGHLRVDLPSYSSVRLDAVSGNGKITNQFAEGEEENSDARTLATSIGADNGAEFKLRAPDGNILIHRGD